MVDPIEMAADWGYGLLGRRSASKRGGAETLAGPRPLALPEYLDRWKESCN